MKGERRLILQYHPSSTGLGNFSSGNIIDSDAGFAFPFLHSITIISSVILGLFIYQATVTKTLRARRLNARLRRTAAQALACGGVADPPTPDHPCVQKQQYPHFSELLNGTRFASGLRWTEGKG